MHRSYIVGRSKIKSFNKGEVNLKNGMKLPVGRQYSADVMASLS